MKKFIIIFSLLYSSAVLCSNNTKPHYTFIRQVTAVNVPRYKNEVLAVPLNWFPKGTVGYSREIEETPGTQIVSFLRDNQTGKFREHCTLHRKEPGVQGSGFLSWIPTKTFYTPEKLRELTEIHDQAERTWPRQHTNELSHKEQHDFDLNQEETEHSSKRETERLSTLSYFSKLIAFPKLIASWLVRKEDQQKKMD